MGPSFRFGSNGIGNLEILSEDSGRVFARGWWRDGTDGRRNDVLVAFPASEQPTPAILDRLAHEYSFKDELDSAWAARPLELVRDRGRTMLVLEDPGGDLLDAHVGTPTEVGRFLRVAVGIASALGKAHQRGFIHKDIKPANILVNTVSGEVRLAGFGIVSRLPRERQPPDPPEVIAGTLAYMAPEQTGRMNRSIDSRSDLYSLGVTLYEMLTGSLPFTASDPMEWIHCHIARQADAPGERVRGIPQVISSIVMKLLAKTAEERYQTAAGVEADLRRCLSEWQSHGRIDPFPLGAHDASDRLLIAEELYGRETEIATLLAAFDRVVAQGTPELVLVSGYSGVGKSAVVNELHKVLVPPRGLFAAGKFDQYKRDIPYATLAQAFQTLIRQILVKGEAELEQWRDALTEALGAHGQLIVNLVPELEFIIGKQPAVPDLPPQEAQNRFKLVFRRFLGTFATAEHPLALFLDDLQWLDAATLDLIEHLVTHAEVRHLLLVGAYRDTEVGPDHPLLRKLESIKTADARVAEIVLAPLGLEDVGRLLASALHSNPERVRPLAQLVHEKTGGNPFFAIQFFTELAEEGSLAFDPAVPGWHWDLDRIRAKNYSGNVVDLMAAKLRRLSAPTQDALKQFACLGNAAETFILILIQGERLHTALAEAVHAGLVVQQERAYKFLHDRIQQAAYSLIPDEHRADVHLRIGRVLLASMTADQLAEHLFDVVNQLNQGAARLIDRDGKAEVATINLRAGRKAKASAAYASARTYFSAGMALLNEHDWSSQYELTFNLWLERAECEFLTGALDTAGQLIDQLLPRAASKVDAAAVYCLKVQLHVVKAEIQRAVAAALTCLRGFGIDMPTHPTQEHVQAEYDAVCHALNGRSIESLIDLPLMADPDLLAATKVLSALFAPAYLGDFNLACLQICRLVRISLQHGPSDASAYAYACWVTGPGWVFRRYDEAYRFAKLAGDLVEKHGFIASRAKVYSTTAQAAAWTQPVATAIDFNTRSFRAAIDMGDLAFACFPTVVSIPFLLLRNDPLDELRREADIALDFVRKVKFGDLADMIVSQQRFIATMQGRTATFSTYSDPQLDEATFDAQSTEGRLPLLICSSWTLELKARFLTADFAGALVAAVKAKQSLAAVAGSAIILLDYYYYAALTVAALNDSASADERQAWRGLLMEYEQQLREWAENNPPTFGDKHALVSAEIARIEGRDIDAMRLYEQAIRSAREQDFVQNEGVAHEVAARFYNARGFETPADAHLRKARHCYLRWGAHGKVRQLDRLYPHLAGPEGRHSAAANDSVAQQLDVASVVKASQALSSEIALPKLIEQLMKIAIQNAGADRGVLILPSGDEYLIQAEARAAGGQIEVKMRREPITEVACPESLVRYVIRTHETVILDDASKPNLFSADDYLRGRQSSSMLCLPLIKQQRLTGILLLENALTTYAFTADRIVVLELLAAQAAISLENSRLYGELLRSGANLQLQVDLLQQLPVSAWTLKPDGTPDFVNQVWLEFAGQTLDFIRSHPEAWMTAIHPEDREFAARTFWKAVQSGQGFAFETRTLRARDGVYRRHLQQAVVLRDPEGRVLKFVGTTTDIDDQKRAEEALYQAAAELAHANRIATMGQLATSLAHEVNQPIGAALVNAGTVARWLGRQPPNVEEARLSNDRVISDVRRVADIVSRIHGFSKKAPEQRELLAINDAIQEIMILAQAAISAHGVSVKMQLAEKLPRISGDRVQLQQVILNLIMNAVEAMSEVAKGSRELKISTSGAAPDGVLVSVGDTGPGLPQANVEHLFEAFYTTKPSGLGMGLSICRSIIQNHGGRLWATPNEPRGAVFYVMLPIGKKALENPE